MESKQLEQSTQSNYKRYLSTVAKPFNSVNQPPILSSNSNLNEEPNELENEFSYAQFQPEHTLFRPTKEQKKNIWTGVL